MLPLLNRIAIAWFSDVQTTGRWSRVVRYILSRENKTLRYNTVLILHLIIVWNHNINIVYRHGHFFSIFVKLLALYAVYKSMRFVAPWRWPQPVAEQYNAVTNKYCATKVYLKPRVRAYSSYLWNVKPLRYKPQGHNLFNGKIYLIPRILKCNNQHCSWIIRTLCQTPLSRFGMNSIHISVISETILCRSCGSVLHVSTCVFNWDLACEIMFWSSKNSFRSVTSFQFPSYSSYSPSPLQSSTHH
jgi:hypothetical protein